MKRLLFGCLFFMWMSGSFAQTTQYYINDTLRTKLRNWCYQPIMMPFREDTLPGDLNYELRRVYIENDCLQFAVWYTGGCGTVYFKLYVNTMDVDNDGVLHGYLWMNDKDECKQTRFADLSFDMAAFKKYMNKKHKIQIYLENYEHGAVEYEFRD